MAVLRRIQRFQNQLTHAQEKLNQIYQETQSLSNLTISQKDYYDQEIDHSDYIFYDLHGRTGDLLDHNDLLDHDDDLPDQNDDLQDHKDDLEIKNDLQDFKQIIHDHKNDLQEHKDDLQNIKEENLINTEIKLNNSNDLVEVEKDLVNTNVDFDETFEQASSKSYRDVRITGSFTQSNSKAKKKKLKSLTNIKKNNIKKEYKSYANHIRHKNWKKPFTQYFTEVYLDEEDVEMNFLKKDRKRKGCKMNFQCESCSLTYARKIDLDRHTNLNHHEVRVVLIVVS